jgi:hypothetical protein
MPNLLNDFLPWESSEIQWSARQKFLEFFWDDLEEFNLTMRCQGTEDLVNPKLKAALVALDRDPQAAILFLREAKKSLEEFATSVVPDSFIKEARDEYLDNAGIEHKWNGKEAA